MKIARSLVLVGAVALLSPTAYARTSAEQPTATAVSSSSPSYDVQTSRAARDTNRYRAAVSGNSADGSLCGLSLVATCSP